MKKLRWGILSTSNFARTKIIPAMRNCRYAEITAIASRDLDKARKLAAEQGIARAYGSYEELLADPEIEVIYNPLPNHMHVHWSIKSLAAGKNVLCEKPIALSSAEALSLLAEAKKHPKLKVMEAFMYRHHPQWQHAKRLVEEGKIGELRTIQSFFSYFNTNAANIRNIADAGGGGIMDIGCYNISLSRFIFAAEPQRVLGIIDFDPDFKTDRLASGILDFGRGAATFTCSTQLSPYQRVNIFGTEGRIEIEIPFNAPPDRPCKIWHQSGTAIEQIDFEVCDQY
ncbi:MAG: Gfo/Idh/MocA family oxidoreductase, partial [Blastocatellia bacterium]|nr:Gfo/Idh/MocA family oxidoreductase [Blastocatellia bacterium]